MCLPSAPQLPADDSSVELSASWNSSPPSCGSYIAFTPSPWPPRQTSPAHPSDPSHPSYLALVVIHSRSSSGSINPSRPIGPCHVPLSIPLCVLLNVCGCPAAEGICADKALFGLQQFGDTLPPPPTISKSDEEFLAMGLEFVQSRDDIKITELNELFEKVGLGAGLEPCQPPWQRSAAASMFVPHGRA